MTGTYREIDTTAWKRAVHCEVFRSSRQPQYGISLELDSTHFLEEVRRSGFSFTVAMTYAAAECANAVEEFRYRFLDGRIVLFDRIHTSFTYLHEDTGLFKVVRVDMQDSMAAYVALAAETVKKQTAYFAGPPEPDVFQFSAIPWISFTHISHTDSGRPDNAVPLIDWGKYRERDGRMPLPFSVQVHHSFVDALHVGQFVNRLQQYLDTWQPADE